MLTSIICFPIILPLVDIPIWTPQSHHLESPGLWQKLEQLAKLRVRTKYVFMTSSFHNALSYIYHISISDVLSLSNTAFSSVCPRRTLYGWSIKKNPTFPAMQSPWKSSCATTKPWKSIFSILHTGNINSGLSAMPALHKMPVQKMEQNLAGQNNFLLYSLAPS